MKDPDKSVSDRVIACIANCGFDVRDVTRETHFDELGMDSLDSVEILMELEDHFSFEIADRDTEDWTTVGDIITTVERLS